MRKALDMRWISRIGVGGLQDSFTGTGALPMPLRPRSPRPRMREPSVITMASTSFAGQFQTTAEMAPLSAVEMYRPWGAVYRVW